MAPRGAIRAPWGALGSARAAAEVQMSPQRAVMFLGLAEDTGSKPAHFAVEGDSATYWTKWPGNDHGDQSLAHEWIVAKLGQWLEAPVCEPALVAVDGQLVNGVSANGISLPAGTYFGSRYQAGAESTTVEWVERDGNASRFARLLALWEWCLGEDAQFFYDARQDLQVWSFDHGLWFANYEPAWSVARVRDLTHAAWEWPDGQRFGVSADSLVAAADRVASVDEAVLIGILEQVPLSWTVTDEVLAAIGEFLLTRAPTVEQSLRRRARSAGMGR